MTVVWSSIETFRTKKYTWVILVILEIFPRGGAAEPNNAVGRLLGKFSEKNFRHALKLGFVLKNT